MTTWVWAFCSLLALAFYAISDDPGPFLGSYESSHLLKISPVICLYDVIWKFVDIILNVFSLEIREKVVEEGSWQPRVTSSSVTTALLDLTTVKLALEIFSCQGMPWTQMFAACYLAHIYVTRIQRWFLQTMQLDIAPKRERRHQITRTIFLPAAHLIVCILTFTLSGLQSYITLIVSGILMMGFLGYISVVKNSNIDFFIMIWLYNYLALISFMLNQHPTSMDIEPGAWGDIRIFVWDFFCFFSSIIACGSEAFIRLNTGLFFIMGILTPFLAYWLGWTLYFLFRDSS